MCTASVIYTGNGPKVEIVAVEGRCGLPPSTLYLSLLYGRGDSADNVCRDLVLQVKYVFQGSIEPVSPKMCSGRAVDELPRDADPLSCLTDAAFQDVADAQVLADLLDVDRPSFVGE